MWKKLILVGVAVIAVVPILNIAFLQRHVWDVLHDDPRNDGIDVWVHYRYGVIPNELVYDLRNVDELKSPIDVTRVLFQISAKLKNTDFDRVYIAYRGNERFILEGEYFETLGKEHGLQNPIYVIRTMPENIYELNGNPAFGRWSGGWLGVMNSQMEDFNDFHRRWYIEAH